jgi:hypothetical protein
VKATVALDGDYRQPEGYRLPEARTLPDRAEELAGAAAGLAARFPQQTSPLDDVVARLRSVTRHGCTAADAARTYDALLDVVGGHLAVVAASGAGHGGCSLEVDEREVRLRIAPEQLDDSAARESEAPSPLLPAEFLRGVMALAAARRRAGGLPTRSELFATHVGATLIRRGVSPAGPLRVWDASGFRDHQTYMSVTDPGEGHLDGTARRSEHLDGVIVHVEHLERGTNQRRDELEPYRIPDTNVVGRVRLAIGADAPTSSYVGRPNFKSSVRLGTLKAVHVLAAACSGLFADGLTECKIAVEGMTATESISLLRALSASVRREPGTQILSAAFNLNTPIEDDRAEARAANDGSPVLVGERLEVGLLGIEIAAAAGFAKVTWDGTENRYPSRCVLDQLDYAEALTLVHRAHERGLLTYFSAGFRLHHIPLVVHTGVDGVGIGGSQVLRYMDRTTGHHGPFTEERIPEILRRRDEAEVSPLGRAARLLARLDRMSYERSLAPDLDGLRQHLFAALVSAQGTPEQTSPELETLVGRLGEIEALPVDEDHPLVCWVGRLQRGGADTVAAELLGGAWDDRLARLMSLRDCRDLPAIMDELSLLVAAAAPVAVGW